MLVHNGDTDEETDSGSKKDRSLPVYEDPKDIPKAGPTDKDHRDSQTAFPERKNDKTNLAPEDRYVNRGPRAAQQKELIQYEIDLAERTGMSIAEIREKVTAGEWKALRESVTAIPSGRMDTICAK